MINIVSLFLASLLGSKIKGLSIFRTVFYLPSIVPAVASAALWMFLCNPMFGLFNTVLGWDGHRKATVDIRLKTGYPRTRTHGHMGSGKYGYYIPSRDYWEFQITCMRQLKWMEEIGCISLFISLCLL